MRGGEVPSLFTHKKDWKCSQIIKEKRDRFKDEAGTRKAASWQESRPSEESQEEPSEVRETKSKSGLLTVWQGAWRRNRGPGWSQWWNQIWGGGGQRMRRTQGMGGVGLRGPREEKGDTQPRQGLGGAGEGGRRDILTLVLVRLALALARRAGLTASAIDPTASGVAVCFCQPPALPTTCPAPPPGLSHDQISTTPGEGAATRSLYGLQRRTNHSGRASHWMRMATPLSSRPRPLAQVLWASRLLGAR